MEACTAVCGTFACVLAWIDAHATAVVALIAIAFTFWQINVAREHNRLSVRPRLVLWLDSSTPPGGPHTTVVVAKNLGLGPAYVTRIRYLYGGAPLDAADAEGVQQALRAAFDDAAAKAVPLLDLRGVLPVPRDGELRLVRLETDAAAGSLKDHVERLRAHFRTEIDYLSPYDERLHVSGSAGGPGMAH